MHYAEDASVEVYPSVDLLPEDAMPLLHAVDTVFLTRRWWQTVESDAMPTGAVACYLLARVAGQVAAIMPMRRSGRTLEGMTTPYTCVYKPVLTADLSERNLQAVARALGAYLGRSGLVRVDALPIEWPMLSSFVAGLRDSGLRVLPFDHFGNWYEDVADDRWDAYLAARPGALRETIRRRLRRADRLASARFTLLDAPGDVAGGVSAYEAVYERSWKEPEPFPRFNGTLMHAFAQDRTLRLGLWFVDDVPAAAQFWVVRDGYATVLKLAHDEAFKAHSPGTVLSSLMIRHLLDRERVRTLDFGRGDDPYKQGWVGSRRQRIGLMLANPWSAAGQAAILRATLARARNRLLGG